MIPHACSCALSPSRDDTTLTCVARDPSSSSKMVMALSLAPRAAAAARGSGPRCGPLRPPLALLSELTSLDSLRVHPARARWTSRSPASASPAPPSLAGLEMDGEPSPPSLTTLAAALVSDLVVSSLVIIHISRSAQHSKLQQTAQRPSSPRRGARPAQLHSQCCEEKRYAHHVRLG